MEWINYVSYFFGGVFFTNAIPHFVNGVMGKPFQSPFASPPGKGLSSSTTNILWGFINLLLGYMFIFQVGFFDMRSGVHAISVGLGILVTGLMLSRIFGRLHGGNAPIDLNQQ